MTQEEKDLLLKDLCARLPYGLKLRYVEDLVVKKETHIITLNNVYLEHIINGDADIKPYLRPMSSMTTEEEYEYHQCKNADCFKIIDSLEIFEMEHAEMLKATALFFSRATDWLNKNGFDYRGLIEKGLAIEAPKGMYKF